MFVASFVPNNAWALKGTKQNIFKEGTKFKIANSLYVGLGLCFVLSWKWATFPQGFLWVIFIILEGLWRAVGAAVGLNWSFDFGVFQNQNKMYAPTRLCTNIWCRRKKLCGFHGNWLFFMPIVLKIVLCCSFGARVRWLKLGNFVEKMAFGMRLFVLVSSQFARIWGKSVCGDNHFGV